MTAPITWGGLTAKCEDAGLDAIGGFHPSVDDDLPPGTETVVLLAPREPGFWARVSSTPEFSDGARDPLDRWSRRVIGHLACDLSAKALFPFSGPPWRPFLSWATRTGQVHASPIGLLVHSEAGLFFSVRGALALKERLDLPPPVTSPCVTCSGQPCRTACPVGAFGTEGYDTSACHSFLDSAGGADCMGRGCRARRACPISTRYPRADAQSAFHMRAFHGTV
ncbi:MAG: ferredoxin [Pseudomonadota bacterium]